MEAAIAYDATKFIEASIKEVQTHADRGRADRDRGDLPVPGQPALDHHSRRHHSAVADRRDVRSAGARLLDQSADAAGAGAGHRPGGRRRHRRGGEHPPAYRGGHAALRCGHHRGARNRRAGDLDDDHAGGGLCADRLRGRPDRRAVPRVRVHAGRRRHRLGHHRVDAVADDGLQAAEGGAQQRPLRAAFSIACSAACGGATRGGCIARSIGAR